MLNYAKHIQRRTRRLLNGIMRLTINGWQKLAKKRSELIHVLEDLQLISLYSAMRASN